MFNFLNCGIALPLSSFPHLHYHHFHHCTIHFPLSFSNPFVITLLFIYLQIVHCTFLCTFMHMRILFFICAKKSIAFTSSSEIASLVWLVSLMARITRSFPDRATCIFPLIFSLYVSDLFHDFRVIIGFFTSNIRSLGHQCVKRYYKHLQSGMHFVIYLLL